MVGPQAGATAAHTYAAAGVYTVTVTVTDSAGLSSTASSQVTVGASDQPPAASVSVSPSSGAPPLLVTADASASTDTDATPISTYRFDFGDGTVVGPQAGATAAHTYAAAGVYTVTVTVTDSAGLSSTARTTVSVSSSGGNLVGNPGFETDLTGWNTSGSGSGITLARVAGGHSGGWSAKLTNTNTSNGTVCLNDSPDWVRSTTAGTYTGSIWVRTDGTATPLLKLRFREYVGGTLAGTATAQVALSTSWQQVTVTYTVASPGSTLDLNAYLSSADAPPGTVFYADDAAITHS